MALVRPLRAAMLALILAFAGLAGVTALPATETSAAPASNLSARVVCANDVISVEFSWVSSGDGWQWLDIGLQSNFAPGTFAANGPLSPGRNSIEWDTVSPNTTYFIRVNTNVNGAWQPSDTLELKTPACGAPAPEPEAPETETPEPEASETATPAPQAPATGAMAGLQASLAAQIAAAGFETAVAVTDLQTGETIHVNGDREQFAGCTMNLFALMQAVIDVQNGLYPESAVGDLIAATIYGSNPVTARDILLISGNGDIIAAQNKINVLIESMGLTNTFYDHPPAYWPSYSLRGWSNMTTALDVNKALAAFWHGEVMTAEWRNYLFDKLTGVKPGLNYLIPAGVAGGVTAHKNGFLVLDDGWVDNDAGIVTFQSNGQTYAYAITFLTQKVPTKYGDIPLGQTISSLVWQYFSTTY